MLVRFEFLRAFDFLRSLKLSRSLVRTLRLSVRKAWPMRIAMPLVRACKYQHCLFCVILFAVIHRMSKIYVSRRGGL